MRLALFMAVGCTVQTTDPLNPPPGAASDCAEDMRSVDLQFGGQNGPENGADVTATVQVLCAGGDTQTHDIMMDGAPLEIPTDAVLLETSDAAWSWYANDTAAAGASQCTGSIALTGSESSVNLPLICAESWVQ